MLCDVRGLNALPLNLPCLLRSLSPVAYTDYTAEDNLLERASNRIKSDAKKELACVKTNLGTSILNNLLGIILRLCLALLLVLFPNPFMQSLIKGFFLG